MFGLKKIVFGSGVVIYQLCASFLVFNDRARERRCDWFTFQLNACFYVHVFVGMCSNTSSSLHHMSVNSYRDIFWSQSIWGGGM